MKAERLDLDAATAFVRSLAGPQADWPDEAQLSLDIGRAISSGQELRPLVARLGYGPKTISLEQLKIGQPDSVTVEGAGSFDRLNATGKLALNASAASLGQLTAWLRRSRRRSLRGSMRWGRVRGRRGVKLALDLDKNAGQTDRANVRAVVDIDAPQLKGVTTITAKPPVAAVHGIDLQTLGRSDIAIESKLSSEQGRSLLALLGLDRTVAAGEARRNSKARRRGVGAGRCG